MFRKNPSRTNYCSIFSSRAQNLTVFSIVYLIRIRFFGPRDLFPKGFRDAQYVEEARCALFAPLSQCARRLAAGLCVFVVKLKERKKGRKGKEEGGRRKEEERGSEGRSEEGSGEKW